MRAARDRFGSTLPHLLVWAVIWLGFSTGEASAQAPGRPATSPPAALSRPTLFIIGDSTVRNGSGDGAGKLWGWGDRLAPFFDSTRIDVVNRARGGRSSRTFQTEGLWNEVLAELKPGDFVIAQFGHNDGGQLFKSDRPRGSIKGIGDESESGVVEMTGKAEVVHTFGWYLRQYARDTKAKGALPILASPVPRRMWKDGRIVRAADSYGGWAAAVARAEGVAFIDINERIAAQYEQRGEEAVKTLFEEDHTHTNAEGADRNAACVVASLKQLPQCPLCDFLLPLASESAACGVPQGGAEKH